VEKNYLKSYSDTIQSVENCGHVEAAPAADSPVSSALIRSTNNKKRQQYWITGRSDGRQRLSAVQRTERPGGHRYAAAGGCCSIVCMQTHAPALAVNHYVILW